MLHRPLPAAGRRGAHGGGGTSGPCSPPMTSSAPGGRPGFCGWPMGPRTGCWPAGKPSGGPTGRWWPDSSSATTVTCRRRWRRTSGRPGCRICSSSRGRTSPWRSLWSLRLLRRFSLVGRLLGGAAALLVFCAMTRFEPSVLRAGAMSGLALVAAFLGRPVSGLRLLALAGAGLMVVDPFLVHSLGFGLSCGASAGILLLAGPLAGRLPGPPAGAGTPGGDRRRPGRGGPDRPPGLRKPAPGGPCRPTWSPRRRPLPSASGGWHRAGRRCDRAGRWVCRPGPGGHPAAPNCGAGHLDPRSRSCGCPQSGHDRAATGSVLWPSPWRCGCPAPVRCRTGLLPVGGGGLRSGTRLDANR